MSGGVRLRPALHGRLWALRGPYRYKVHPPLVVPRGETLGPAWASQ